MNSQAQEEGGYFGKASVSKAVYGLVTVLAVLVIMGEHPPTAWRGAAILFGTTLAVALADAYAETLAGILARGRSLSRVELREIWHDVAPVLVGAQAPTLVMVLAAIGLVPEEHATRIALGAGLVLLFGYGWRVGQTLHARPFRAFLSGLLLAALGALIIAIKVVFH